MIKIAPSILSADFTKIFEAVKMLEAAGADYIHCDIMDGSFVPNITFGQYMIRDLRKATKLPLDVHLMIENPDKYIVEFAEAGADIENGSIHFIDTEWFAGPLYRFSKLLFPNSEHSVFLVSSLDFFLFDYLALRKVRGWQRRGRQWDLIHISKEKISHKANFLIWKNC